MDYFHKLRMANILADTCNGRLVSTSKQLKNETFVFEFDGAPNIRYAIYKSGYVRYLTPNSGRFGNQTFMGPCITTSVTGEDGRRVRSPKLVDFNNAFAYLQKRFYV